MQRDRLSHLLARTRDPAFALTARAEIWAWNPAAEAITGFAAADALHQSFTTLVDARGPLCAWRKSSAEPAVRSTR
jgi:PAS domain-containing protein